jgi:hypothetical protein
MFVAPQSPESGLDPIDGLACRVVEFGPEDPLAPMRGAVLGTTFGALAWALLGATVWLVQFAF